MALYYTEKKNCIQSTQCSISERSKQQKSNFTNYKYKTHAVMH